MHACVGEMSLWVTFHGINRRSLILGSPAVALLL